MEEKIIPYAGQEITVLYDIKRCIHAGECAKGLPEVFDSNRKPWVDPDRGAANDLVEVIERCPSGALKYVRHDGGVLESPDPANTIVVSPNGPLYVRGDVQIKNAEGDVILKDTRIALCRCGASGNKPLCDRSHLNIGFEEPGRLGESKLRMDEEMAEEGVLTITVRARGSYLIQGPVEIFDAARSASVSGSIGSLCRCGGSKNKPFCDATHRAIGFEG